MGYILNEEQMGLRDMIRKFLQKELVPVLAEYDERAEMPMHLVKQGLDMGLHMMDIPEEYGGLGLDDFTTQMLVQEMSRFDAGFTTAFALTSMALKVVLDMGNEEQKKRAASFIASGKIGAFCLTEPQGGSDSVNMLTTAKKDGCNYILNGTKCFISNAAIADLFIVMAVTDRDKGAKGISAFIVERSTPGVTVGKHENKIGMRLSPTNEITFTDAVVPGENILGKEGLGFVAAMRSLQYGRITTASLSIGVAQRALEEAVKYSKERVIFGKPIAKQQGIAFMLADMDASVEACRCLVKHALDLKNNGLPYAKESSMCKLLSSDAAMKVTVDAVQIFGGYGVCKEYPVERLMQAAKILQIVEGTNQIQRILISENLLKEY